MYLYLLIVIIIIIIIIYVKKRSKFWTNQNVDFNNKNEGIIQKDKYKLIKSPKNMNWNNIININEIQYFVNNNFLDNTYYPKIYIKKMLINSKLISLKLNNQIIGMLIFRPIIINIKNKILKVNYIDLFSINKKYRKTGISNLIMLKLKNYCIKHNHHDVFIFKKEHSKLPFNYISTIKNYYLNLDNFNHTTKNNYKINKNYNFYNLHKSDLYQIFNKKSFNFYFKNDKTNITFTHNNYFCNISILYSVINNQKYLTGDIGYFIGDYDFFIYILNQLKNKNFKYINIMNYNLNKKIINLLTFNTNVYFYMHNYHTNINSIFFNQY